MPSFLELYDLVDPVKQEEDDKKTKERTRGESAADGFRSFGASVNNTLKTVTDLAGTDNPVSNFLADNAKSWQDDYSPAYKAELQKQATERAALGEDPSYVDRALLAAKQTLRNPIEGLGEMAGNIAPIAVGGLAGLGAKGMVGLSAAMGAGAVKGGIAETIQNAPESALVADPLYAQLRADGLSEQDAKTQLAEQRASYGEAYGKILLGGSIGALVGKFGSVENAFANMGKAGAAKSGLLKNTGVGVAKEVGTEMPQEMMETYLGNRGAAEQGANIAADQGVIEAGVKAGILSAPAGAVAGASNSFGKPPEAPPAAPPVDPLPDQIQAQVDQGNSPLSRAAQASNPALAPDEISLRAKEVEDAFRANGLLQKLGEMGQGALTRQEFLEALAIAKNKNMPPEHRQMALQSLDQAMQWIADGKMPNEPGTGTPFSTELATQPAPVAPGTDLATVPGGELTNPGMPQAFDPNVVDVDATRVDNMVGGPRALPAPTPQISNQPEKGAGPAPFSETPGEADAAPTSPDSTAPEGVPQGRDNAEAGVGSADGGGYGRNTEPGGAPAGAVGQPGQYTGQAPDPTVEGTNREPTTTQAVQAAQEGQKAPAARKPVEAPQVFTPAGEGPDASLPATVRRRKAQLAAMAADGFETVETRGNGFYLVNTKANTEMKLDGMGDAQRARKAIADFVQKQSDTAAASPNNDRLNPTDGQIAAGNYKKSDVIPMNGMRVVLENPRGSTRSGVGKDGKRWSNTMKHHYGEILGTEASDGDRLDTFIGTRPDSNRIFVIDQLNDDGTYDESKVMQGFMTEEDARKGYLDNYDKGWKGLGAITEMTPQQVMAWAKSDLAKKPAAEYAQRQTTGVVNDGQNTGPTGPGLDTGTGPKAGVSASAGDRGAETPASRDRPDVAGGAIAVAGNEEVIVRNAETLRKTRLALDRYRANLQAQLNGTTDPGARGRLQETIRNIPEASDPDGKDLQDYANIAAAWNKAFGSAAAAYSDGRADVSDGFQMGDQTLVNLMNRAMPLQWTMAHEFKHLSEEIPGLKALYDSIFRLIPGSAKAEYFQYLRRTKQVTATSIGGATKEDLIKLRQEMVADFLGQRFIDRDWLEKLAKQKPNLFGEFIRDWLNILQSLISEISAILSKDDNAKDVDRLMRGHLKQLEEMKSLATEVAIQWAERNPKLAQSTGADQSIRNSAKDLQAELDEAMSGKVSDASIKVKGVMAEDAYPDLEWKKDKSGFQETASAPIDGSPNLQRIEMNEDLHNDSLWDGSMNGTWVGPAMSETDGKGTKKGVKAFLRRQVAAIDLRARKFDLASTIEPDKLANLVQTWKALHKVDGSHKYAAKQSYDKGLAEIARSMGVTDAYEVEVRKQASELGGNEQTLAVIFIDKKTGADYSATLTLHTGSAPYLDANTLELGKSGLGGAFYQMAAEYAAVRNLQLYPESGISGINSYRRTEQQISAALRTGRSNVMVPHRTQRVHGFENKPMTQAKHDANLGRLLLAGMRNAQELIPSFNALRYHPETGIFTNSKGVNMEAAISKLLSAPDARAFGMGRSTLARSVMTNMILKGELTGVESFKEPVLYSARDTAEQEYKAVEAQYKGTDGWMKAPDGSKTLLTERQWVQTRTPSFINWFGDWIKGDIWNRDDVSKAVGGNGEPLVVYHGTDKGGFYAFKQPGGKKRGDLGIFTTSNPGMARSYVRKGRVQEMSAALTRDDLEVQGFEFQEGFSIQEKFYDTREEAEDDRDDGGEIIESVRVTAPDGYDIDGPRETHYRFTSMAQAVEAAAESYDGDGDKSTIYAAFINLRNTYETDFEGAMWTGSRDHQWTVVVGGDLQTDSTGKQYFSEDEARELAKTFADPDDEYEGADFMVAADEHWETTDSAVRDGLSGGHDGTIIRNVIDDGGGYGYDLTPSDVFVVNKPGQLKSADFNTGEFGGRDDIRYSAQDRSYKLDLDKTTRAVGKYSGLSQTEKTAIEEGAKEFGLSPAKTSKLMDTARMQKKRFPTAAGWAPIEVAGVKLKKDIDGNPRPGTESPKFQEIAYGFNVPPGAKRAPPKIDEAWMGKVTEKFGDLVDDLYQRADAGDKNAQTIIAHQTWYRNVAEILRREYGAQGDFLADLLGATSPNTPVDTNWRFSLEIMRRFVRGEFAPMMKKFVDYLDKGGKPSQFPSAAKVRQLSGKLYGINSGNAMVAMADLWRNIEPGSAPKARNFALNLIGQSNMATIDVWAARMLRRAANQVRGADLPRIPPVAESGVSGVWNADVTGVTGAFGFGAEVMRRVAEQQQAKGRNITPPDLQAIAWFAEKELWGSKGWTTKMGEGGSFEENIEASPVERYLAGFSIQQGEKVPEKGDVSTAQARILAALTGDDSVVAARAHPTYGLYAGVIEHSFDTEWTVAKGQHDPSLVMAEISRLSKENGQYDMFVSRVVAPDENNPNARPGVEIYFKTKRDLKAAMPVLEQFTARGQDGFTMATDVRSKSGSEEFIGVRLQYVPEISMRWDEGLRKELLAPGGIEKVLAEKAKALNAIAADVRMMDGVAYAQKHEYDTVVVGKENYDEYIDRATPAGNSGPGSKPWFGQPVRQGLEGAVARYEGQRGQDGAGRVPDAGGGLQSSARDRDGQRGVYGENGPGARPFSVSVTGTHFSQQARKNLLGAYNGTGLKGAEAKRLAETTDQRIKSRVYFYVDEGNGLTPESGVGGIAHSADIQNLYNTKGDPLKLFKASDLNGSESRVLDAGYNGYYFPSHSNNQGIAVVLGKAADSIPVTLAGYEKGKAPVVAEAPYKRALTSKELSAIDMPALQAVAPSAKLRMGNLTMDASELPAAREELTKQGVELPAVQNSAREASAQLSMEFKPGLSTGLLSNMGSEMTSRDQKDYLVAIRNALSRRAANAQTMLGWGKRYTESVDGGAWKGLTGWSIQASLQLPDGKLDERTRNEITFFLSLNGLLTAQEGMAWHLPKFGEKGLGVEFNLGGKKLRDTQFEEVYAAIQQEFGRYDIPPIPSKDGLRFLNFTGLEQEEFTKKLKRSIAQTSVHDIWESTHYGQDNRGRDSTTSSPDGRIDSPLRAGSPDLQAGRNDDINAFQEGVRTFDIDGDLIENDWTRGDGQYRQKLIGAWRLLKELPGHSLPKTFDALKAYIQTQQDSVNSVNQRFASEFRLGKSELTPQERETGVGTSSEFPALTMAQTARAQGAYFRHPDGTLMTMYHGSGKEIGKLESRDGIAFFATTLPHYANEAARISAEYGEDDSPNVAPVNILSNNPFDWRIAGNRDKVSPFMERYPRGIATEKTFDAELKAGKFELLESNEFIDAAKRAGFDAVLVRDDKNFTGFVNVGVFDPRDVVFSLSPLFSKRDLVNTPAFKTWSKGSPLVMLGEKHDFKSGAPVTVEVLHGTTNPDIFEFSRDKAGIESDFGAGFYASNNPTDVAKNYASDEGPDLTNKIERTAERIESDDEFEGDHGEALRQARAQLSGSAPNTMKLFMRFDNPVVVGKNETFLDYSEEYDEENDSYAEPTGKLVEFAEAVREIAPDFNAYSRDIEKALANLWDDAVGEGLDVSEAAKIIKLQLMDATDDNGDSASSEIVRQALAAIGFDGIIDTSVSKKFKNMGIPTGTVHFIAFEPAQIKSAVGNNGKFSLEDPRILHSKKDQTETPAFKKWYAGSNLYNEDGTPMVLYHGTNKDFTAFKSSKSGLTGAGAYLSPDPEVASGYDGDGKGGERLMPVYARGKFMSLDTWSKYVQNEGGWPQAKAKAESEGYAGVWDQKYEDAVNVWNPDGNIKSAIGNNGNFDGAKADIRHSKRDFVGRTNRTYTPEQLRAFANVGFEVEIPSLKERAKALWKDAGKKLAQGIVDQFAPVKEISKEAYGLLRLAKGASGAFETMLQGGRLKLTDGVYDFDETKKGGVLDRLLKPMQGEHHDFLRWVAANRAERLMGEDREHLFTQADIDAIKTLADGDTKFDYTLQHGPRAGQTTRNRAEVWDDSLITFNEFHENVMDMAEQSGLVDKEARKLWDHEFYVPFYRVSDENGVAGMNIKGGAVRQQAFKKLKGGTDALNSDLLDNTLMNWAHLLDASAKNRAAKATLEAAESVNIAISTTEETARQMGKATGNRNGVVWFMDEGKQHYYLVEDPFVLQAITSLEFSGMKGPMMNAMSAMKNMLTVGVTASPFFKVRNLIRDSIQVIGTGNISFNPAKNLSDGWKLTNPKHDMYFRMLAGGGTIHFGTMYEGSEARRVQALVESGVDRSTILGDEHQVQAFYRKYLEPAVTAYNELGNRGESINRAALYDQLIKQGVSHADASLQARDLMDFSMQGSFATVRFLTQIVPFLNARLQGMYKLGRGAKEDPKRMAYVTGAVVLASLGLLAAYGDDDDWRKREDWDRDNYWWFKFGGIAFRIPKPFEIGAIGTLAERSAELVFDDEMTGKHFRGRVLSLLGDNLAMNPVPQLVKPMLDVYANRNSFNGRPIETMGMERLQSDYRFTGSTSMTARAASTAMNSVTGLIGKEALSPVQIDSLITGYFGWLGMFAVGSADMLARAATDQPTRPAIDSWKWATGGIIAQVEGAPGKYVSRVYEQAKEIEMAYGTWRNLQKEGKTEEAQEFRAANADKIVKYRNVEAVKGALSKINQQIRAIERSDMDRDAKRAEINRLNARKDQFARRLAA